MMLALYSSIALAALMLLLLLSRPLQLFSQPQQWPHRLVLAVLLLAATQTPLDGVTLAGHWRATIAEPAITTVLLLLLLAYRKLRGTAPTIPLTLRQPLALIGAIALVFYPLTMGVSLWDPYRLGYQPQLLLAVVFLLALWCWYRRQWLAAVALAVATATFRFELLTSNNYWDYLLDPMLGGFGALLLLQQGWQLFSRTRQNRKRQPAAAS